MVIKLLVENEKNKDMNRFMIFFTFLLVLNATSAFRGFAQWSIQNSNNSNELESIYFLDTVHGWAVGSGTILKTNNGGLTWTDLEYDKPDDWLTSVLFTDSLKGWIVGIRFISIFDSRGIILHTLNGGLTWDEIEDSNNYFYSVFFINDSVGWVGGTSIFQTVDQGGNWTLQKDSIFIRELFFITSNIGWAVGDNGVIIKTSDSGYTWTTQQSPINDRLWSVDFVNNLNGWISGDEGIILKTTDGGSNWIKLTTNTTTWLFSISAKGNNHCWAAGMWGEILHTSDGGVSWELQENPNPAWIWSIHFLDSLHGWTCGENGVILSTNNGGTVNISETVSDSDILPIFPNPSSKEINIEVGAIQNIKFQFFTLQGKQVKNLTYNNSSGEQKRLTIEISDLPNGIYLLKIITNYSSIYKKIIKK